MISPRIAIIGGGINGRMVQHFIPGARIYDWGAEPTVDVPRFHGANYLWEPIPGLRCREMRVFTVIDNERPTIEGIRRYKKRIGKDDEVMTEVGAERALNSQFCYDSLGYELLAYPPSDIVYNAHILNIAMSGHYINFRNGQALAYDYLVSTIPLPSLMGMIGVQGINGAFRQQTVKVRSLRSTMTEPGVIRVNYITDPQRQAYRATYRNGLVQEETLDRKFHEDIGEFHTLTPGKIWDSPRALEMRAIVDYHDIITFGRYGSWDSDELVHMTVRRILEWAKREGIEVANHGQ